MVGGKRPGGVSGKGELSGTRAEETNLTRRRQALGLLLIGGIVLGLALYRAPAHLVFPPGWWRF
jgi:hypothetical protein